MRALWVAVTLIITIGLDQVTKVIATDTLKGEPTKSYLGDVFRLVYATNDGAFLSLGANLPGPLRFFILNVMVAGLLLGLIIWSIWSDKLTRLQLVGYATIAGGGLANWIDRARFDGRVVDFMNLGLGSLRTGIFNVADLWIIVGIGLLFWPDKKKAELAKQETAGPA